MTSSKRTSEVFRGIPGGRSRPGEGIHRQAGGSAQEAREVAKSLWEVPANRG